jgi:hypothetical protein
VLWPNSISGKRLNVSELPEILEFLWPYRTSLKSRKAFGVPVEERGIPWWALRELYMERLKNPLSITFAFVATHNHFVLDRGGQVFNRSAPIIKLPTEATEDDHLALLGLLNSSTACFWMKQVFFPKGGDYVGTEGARVRKTWWDERYEFAGTQLQAFPLTQEKPLDLSTLLDRVAQKRRAHLPAELAASLPLSRAALNEHKR